VREWGKVSTAFWERGSGKRLRGEHEASLLALHLVSCRWANSIGVFYIPLPAIAHAIGSPLEGAMEALRRVIEAGFCEYDLASEMVWIPNHAEIEIGKTLKATDNRKTSVQEMLDSLGNHPYAVKFWDRYGEAYGLAPSKPLASPFEGPWEPLLSQSKSKARTKQEQEQYPPRDEKMLTVASAEFDARADTEPTPIAQVRGAFLSAYAARYPQASRYPWGAREGGAAKNWLKSVPLDEALSLVTWFFAWKRPEVIKSGHPFCTGSNALVMKFHELRADLAHPERRAFAAAVNNDEQQAIHNSEGEAQTARIVAKITGALDDHDPFRPLAGNGATTHGRDTGLGGDSRQAPERRGDRGLVQSTGSVRPRQRALASAGASRRGGADAGYSPDEGAAPGEARDADVPGGDPAD
jgi:hypothetical protein